MEILMVFKMISDQLMKIFMAIYNEFKSTDGDSDCMCNEFWSIDENSEGIYNKFWSEYHTYSHTVL